MIYNAINHKKKKEQDLNCQGSLFWDRLYQVAWVDVHLLSTNGEHTRHYSEQFTWITACNAHNPLGGKRYYDSHVKEDTKAQKGQLICPKSHFVEWLSWKSVRWTSPFPDAVKVTDVSSISSSVGLSNETFAAKRLTSPRGKLLSKVQGSQKMFALILNDPACSFMNKAALRPEARGVPWRTRPGIAGKSCPALCGHANPHSHFLTLNCKSSHPTFLTSS